MPEDQFIDLDELVPHPVQLPVEEWVEILDEAKTELGFDGAVAVFSTWYQWEKPILDARIPRRLRLPEPLRPQPLPQCRDDELAFWRLAERPSRREPNLLDEPIPGSRDLRQPLEPTPPPPSKPSARATFWTPP